MTPRTISLIQVHIAVLLFGLAGLFGKWVALPASVIVFGRVFFGAAALLLILRWRGIPLRLNNRQDAITLSVSGVILAVHWVTFFQAIQVAGVAVGLIAYATFPVFATFLEPIFDRVRVQRKDIVLAAVTFGGAVLVVPSFELGNEVTQGFLWGVVSAGTFALLSIFNRRNVADYSGLLVAFYQDVVATIVLLPALFLATYTLTAEKVALLVLLGVVFTAIAHSLYIQGLRHVRAQVASIIASLESVYGIIFALVLLGERPLPRVLLGGAIILGAAAYSSIAEQRANATQPQHDLTTQASTGD